MRATPIAEPPSPVLRSPTTADPAPNAHRPTPVPALKRLPLVVHYFLEHAIPGYTMGTMTGCRGGTVDSCELVGISGAIAALRKEIERVAPTPANVVITGESGAGKRHVARLLHHRSRRNAAPFLSVDCSGVPEALLDSELFGHVKGSFHGAYRDKPGMLVLLGGGTMCLAEPTEMTARLQGKLVQFLVGGGLQPVGGAVVRAADVRFVATTTRDLGAEVAFGGLRPDLLHRLRVVQLHVPPLREHLEDIGPLVDYWLSMSDASGLQALRLSTAALEALQQYDWPGNVQELREVVEWAAVYAKSAVIEISDLPPDLLRKIER